MNTDFYCIASVLRFMIQCIASSPIYMKDVGKKKCLKILGNGKSLNENEFSHDSCTEYMVVNRHVLSDTYGEIRPLYYVLADPFFFTNSAGQDILQKINDQTSWKMYLFVPYGIKTKKHAQEIITNPNIVLQYYNAFGCTKPKQWAYFLYNHRLAMPSVQNVLAACIMLGIYMRFSRIELYGVEHSWTKFLFVGEDNQVYLENPHFFDKDKKIEARPMKDIQLMDEYPLYMALENYAQMFKSYWEIKRYLSHSKLPIDIINKTKGSFIDAFRRE